MKALEGGGATADLTVSFQVVPFILRKENMFIYVRKWLGLFLVVAVFNILFVYRGFLFASFLGVGKWAQAM